MGRALKIDIASLRATLSVDASAFNRGLTEAKAATKSYADSMVVTKQALDQLQRGMDAEAQAARREADVKRQGIALERDVLAAKSKLVAVLAEESAAAQAAAAKYPLLTAARRQEIVGVNEQITAQRALQEAMLQSSIAAEKAAAAEVAASAKATAAAEAAAVKQQAAAQRNLGRNLTRAGGALTANLSTPILAVGGAAIASAIDVQGGANQIAASTGAQGAQLQALEAVYKRVAVTVPQSFKEVGTAVGTLFARTHEAGQALTDLATTELNLSRITGGALTDTITKTTQVFDAWHVTVADQVPTLDKLEKAHQTTGINVIALSNTLSRSAATFQAWGLSLNDSIGLLANFQKANIQPERALTGLTTGIGKLAKAGVTDLHAAFRQIIKDLSDTEHPTTVFREAVNLFGTRTGPQFAKAVQDGSLSLQDFDQVLEGSRGSIARTAAATQTFGIRFKTELKAAEIALEPLGISLLKIATQLLQSLKPVIAFVARLTDAFSHLSPGVQQAVIDFALFVAAIGPGVTLIGKLITGFGYLRGAWLAVSTVLTGTEGLAAIAAGFSAVSVTGLLAFGAITAAVLTLIAALVVLSRHQEETRIGWEVLQRFPGHVLSNFDRSVRDPKYRPGLLGILQESSAQSMQESVQASQERRQAAWRQENRLPIFERPGAAAAAAPQYAQANLRALLSGGGPGGLSAADLARLRGAEAGKGGQGKLTPVEQEQKRYTEELAQSQARLNEVLDHQDKITASVAARYHLLTDRQRENLVVVLEQIEKGEQIRKATDKIGENSRVIALLKKGESVAVAESAASYDKLSIGQLRALEASNKELEAAKKAAESRKTYTLELAKTNAEIRRLAAGQAAEGGAIDQLRSRLPGLTEAQYQAATAADQWKKHLDEVRTAAIRVADAIRGVKERLLETQATSKLGEAAVTLFGKDFLRKYPGASAQRLFENLTPAQRRQAREYAGAGEEGDIGAATKALREQSEVARYRSRSSQVAEQFFGKNWEDAAPKQLALIHAQVEEFVKWEAQAQKAGAAQAAWNGETAKTNAFIGTLDFNLSQATDQYEALTGKSDLARQVMEKFGIALRDLPADAQRSVRALLDVQAKMEFFNKLAAGTQQVFQNMFTNLFEHGFKGFFANVKQGFTQLFQQIAAEYLSSQLVKLLLRTFGSGGPGAAGGSSGAGGAGLGGRAPSFAELLAEGANAALGGGGRVDSGAYREGFASGGSVYRGQPLLVGERGPEAFIAPAAGRILSNAQLAGAGAGGGDVHIHQTFNIQTPDVNSFRRSQGQLLSDAHAAAERARRRGS